MLFKLICFTFELLIKTRLIMTEFAKSMSISLLDKFTALLIAVLNIIKGSSEETKITILKVFVLSTVAYCGFFYAQPSVSKLTPTVSKSFTAPLLIANSPSSSDNLFLDPNTYFSAPVQAEPRKKKDCDQYINRFHKVAQAEMEKFGIPASITLAQGLLESNIGTSKLATQNNNHFGIKCFSKRCTKGHCSNFNDDHHKDFFRNYKTAWESYRAHSVLLQKKRYKKLYKLKSTDYTNWAKGLQSAGYATDKQYANKLIKLIKRLNLDRFDKV